MLALGVLGVAAGAAGALARIVGSKYEKKKNASKTKTTTASTIPQAFSSLLALAGVLMMVAIKFNQN